MPVHAVAPVAVRRRDEVDDFAFGLWNIPWSGGRTHIPDVNFWSSGVAPIPRAFEPSPSVAVDAFNSVAEFRSLTGLTASQIGRLFGVSRRSVQNWVAGASMASHHEERLSRLIALVRDLGPSPEDRRRALLSSAHGESVFHRLVAEVGRDAVIQQAPVSGTTQVGA